MNEKNFKNFLNIILIIGAASILILLGAWMYQEYEQLIIEKDANEAILEFESEFIDDVNVVELENEIPISEERKEEIIENTR